MKPISAGVLICLFAISTVAAGDGVIKKHAPEGWTVPLEQLGFNGSLDRLPEPKTWKVKQVSSFDRSGGNDDDKGGTPMEGGGYILADLEGPGVVTRLWTRNPTGTLIIFVDNMESPVIIASFKDFFAGYGDVEHKSPPFNLRAAPYLGESSGGYYCYIPIPFEQRCKIAVKTDEPSLTYQVTYAELPKDTPIQSFSLDLTDHDVEFFRHWEESWKSVAMRWPSKDEHMRKSRHNYWPNTESLIATLEGPATLTEIELVLESVDANILANTWISVTFDGQKEPGVLAPIGAFFAAAGNDTGDHSSTVVGRVAGRMWCRFPMPFHERADIKIINKTDEIADIAYWFTYRDGVKDDDLYFFAQHRGGKTEEGKPFIAAAIEGNGHYMGTTISATNADSLTILEGDDVYLVDGAAADTFHGTGTDDYFNAGWYFAGGAASAPTHAITLKDGDAPMGFMAFRSHLTEPVPFTNSFVFELEHGPGNNRPGVPYSSVAYWYQQSAEATTPQRLAEVAGK